MNPDDIDKAVKALKAQGAPDEAIHAYLRDTLGLQPVEDGHHDYHAEFRSGKLQQRMEAANQRDFQNAAEEGEAAADAPAMVRFLANMAHGIPGAEALQAGVRSVVRGQPYREAYQDIEESRNRMGTGARITSEVAGALPLAGVLPGGAATSGALYGAADRALAADPDAGLGTRAVGAGVGAATGALLGKGADMLVTAGRALLPTLKGPAANILARQAERAKSAADLYRAAIREGQGKTATPMIQQFLAEPDVAEIVSGLQQTRPFKGVSADAPEMLDAVYKVFSDRAGQLKRGLEAVTPNRPNVGRFNLRDTRMAQEDLLTATDPVMPSYRAAVDDYARRSAEIDALKRGYEAVRREATGTMPSASNLTRTTPEAFADYMTNQARTAGERAAAREGALGAAKDALKLNPLTKGRKAAQAAGSVLRAAQDPEQILVDRLIKAGLLPLRALQ